MIVHTFSVLNSKEKIPRSDEYDCENIWIAYFSGVQHGGELSVIVACDCDE